MAASWDLSGRHYGETIGLWAIIAVEYLIFVGSLIAAFVIVFRFSSLTATDVTQIPLGFRLLFVAIMSLILSQPAAFILAVFINRDNEDNPRMTSQEMDNLMPPDLDLSELESDNGSPTPVPAPTTAPVPNTEHTSNAQAAPNTVSDSNTSPKAGTMDVIE